MIASWLILATPLQAQVGSGRIVGGWNYVWAAYLILWVSLCVYGGWLWMAHRKEVVQGGGG